MIDYHDLMANGQPTVSPANCQKKQAGLLTDLVWGEKTDSDTSLYFSFWQGFIITNICFKKS